MQVETSLRPSSKRPSSLAWYEVHRKSVTPPHGVINPALAERGRWPCGSWAYYNTKTGAAGIFRCKSWRCLYCGPRRRGTWVARVTHLLQAWDRVRFWTFTLDPSRLLSSSLTPEAFILRAWRKLRVHLGRRCPRCNRRGRMKEGIRACPTHGPVRFKTPSFVWVLEYTKIGTPHLHVAMDQYVSRAWMKEKWEALTGAWNVHVEAVDPENVTRYLAKYLGKTLTILQEDPRALEVPGSRTPGGRPRYVHIYGSSNDFPITIPPGPTPWTLIRDLEDVGALFVPEEPPDLYEPGELVNLWVQDLLFSWIQTRNPELQQFTEGTEDRPPPEVEMDV